jgi:hypothetical protein
MISQDHEGKTVRSCMTQRLKSRVFKGTLYPGFRRDNEGDGETLRHAGESRHPESWRERKKLILNE